MSHLEAEQIVFLSPHLHYHFAILATTMDNQKKDNAKKEHAKKGNSKKEHAKKDNNTAINTKPKKVVEHSYCLSRFIDEEQPMKFRLPKKKPMADKVLKQIMHKLNPDILFVLGEKAYGCHGVVLRYYSEVYGYCLPTGMIIGLPTDKITSLAFVLAYEWMLQTELQCPRGKLLELLQAAHYFYIPGLVKNLFRCLCDKDCFGESDAIATYFEAKSKNKWGIAKLMLTCVRKYFLLLVCTDEYREMDLSCVCKLLSSDSLAVQSEVEVLFAALYWIFSDYDGRKQHLPVLLQAVRYILIPPKFLINLSAHLHEMVPRVADELLPRLHVAMLLQQELHMGTLAENEIRTRDRYWIIDPGCQYQNSNGQLRKEEIFSPIDFITYLDKLDSATNFLGRIQVKVPQQRDEKSD
ncbi:kelch-like protein 17 [Drosophila montana]|uniref:kelch-like protein 17 n=1 Tax=Drosophila montana TaxID=40370 RepID=UPI00313F131C